MLLTDNRVFLDFETKCSELLSQHLRVFKASDELAAAHMSFHPAALCFYSVPGQMELLHAKISHFCGDRKPQVCVGEKQKENFESQQKIENLWTCRSFRCFEKCSNTSCRHRCDTGTDWNVSNVCGWLQVRLVSFNTKHFESIDRCHMFARRGPAARAHRFSCETTWWRDNQMWTWCVVFSDEMKKDAHFLAHLPDYDFEYWNIQWPCKQICTYVDFKILIYPL